MKELTYFECFKCKNPYFGGKNACHQDNIEEVKIEDFVCGECSGGSSC